MNKYEVALECPNCVLGLNCKTCEKKKVLKEEIEKAQALDTALDLIKQKRENAKLDLERLKKVITPQDFMSGLNINNRKLQIEEEIKTYTDCIITIETEMGRTER